MFLRTFLFGDYLKKIFFENFFWRALAPVPLVLGLGFEPCVLGSTLLFSVVVFAYNFCILLLLPDLWNTNFFTDYQLFCYISSHSDSFVYFRIGLRGADLLFTVFH